jgi:hypothetical protein
MATIQQLRELFGGTSDFDTVQRASVELGLAPEEIADELGLGNTRGGKNSQRMSASVDRYQAGLYGVGEAVSGAVGLRGVQDWMRSGRVGNETEANVASARARNMGAVDSFKDVHSVGDFGDYAVGLGIQSLPYMGEALVGGIAGRALVGGTRAALGGAAAASYPSSVGDILQNQREQNGQTDLLSAAGLGVPYAAANVVGVEGALARGQLFRNGVRALDDIGGMKGGLARASVTAGKTGLAEGASETFQEGMNQFGRMAVDPNETFLNPQSNERFAESFIGGVTLGGITGGVGGGWRRSESYRQPESLLPDAAPLPRMPTEQMELFPQPPNVPANTQYELPGFEAKPDPEAPAGPSVDINPNAPVEKAVREGRAQPQEAQIKPEERDAVGQKYRMETVLDDGTEEGHWRMFGRDFFKRGDLNKALDKQVLEDRNIDPAVSTFATELNNAGTPFMRPRQLNELATSLHGSTPEKTAYNLNAAIAGGHPEAERLAATYEKLTGQESPAWKARQEAPAKPAAAPKPVAQPTTPVAQTTTAAPAAPQTFEDDDFDGMARATLLKLFNGSEQNVEIALADLRGDKPADIQKAFGVSDSQVRKIRSRLAPKALEAAARQAGVPLEKLEAALAKKDTVAELTGETQLAQDEGMDKDVQTSDDRPLTQATDEELTAAQQEKDTLGTQGMTIAESTGTQLADASSRNNSRTKFKAAKENVASKSLTPSDLNNLWVEAREMDDEKLMLAIEREVKMRINRGEMTLADLGESEDVSAPEEAGSAGQPVQQTTRQSAPVRKGSAQQAAGEKKSKGQVGDAWDKMASQVKKAGLDLPTWDKLTPEQQIKAQDKYVLNGKLDMREAQKVLSAKDIEGLPPKNPSLVDPEKPFKTASTGKVFRVKPNGERPMASDAMAGEPHTLAGRVRREIEAPLVDLRKRESVLNSILKCLG